MDFESYLLGERLLSPATARKRVNLLAHAQKTHSFNLEAFQESQETAKAEGVKLIGHLRLQEHSPASISNYAKLLACLSGYYDYNLQFKAPKVPAGQPKAYSAQEMLALRRFSYTKNPGLQRQLRALMMAAYFTAMRPGELCHLDLADLDEANSRVHITHPEKGGRRRWIPVEQELWSPKRPFMAWLNHRSKMQPSTTRVWITWNKHTLKGPATAATFRNWMNQRVKPATGVQATMHRFRHTRAVALHRAGLDVVWIKEYLGHAKLETTWNYLRSLGTKFDAEFRNLTLPGYAKATS